MENKKARNPSETQTNIFQRFNDKKPNVASSVQNGNDVLDNPESFYEKLSKLHESSGLNLVVDIRQTLLDLHVFYKEVVKRGGFCQVNRERKWEEVALALKLEGFDPKCACRLQNTYALFLSQFEKMFFYRSLDKAINGPGHASYVGNSSPMKQDRLKASVPKLTDTKVSAEHASYVENSSAMKQDNLKASYLKLTDAKLISVRNKDKSNYVTVSTVGIPAKPKVHSPQTPSKNKESKKCQGGYPRTSKGKGMKNRPCSYPRRLTGYSIFLKQECDRLKTIHGKNSGGKSLLLMAIDAWRLLPENDRQPYIEESKNYKKRCLEEVIASTHDHPNMQVTDIEKLPMPDKSDGDCHLTPQPNDKNLLEPDKSAVDFANEMLKNVSDGSMLQTNWDNCANHSLDAHIWTN